MDVQPIPPTLGPEFRTEILLLLQWGAVRGAPISFYAAQAMRSLKKFNTTFIRLLHFFLKPFRAACVIRRVSEQSVDHDESKCA